MSTIVYRTWSDLEAQLIKGILELYGIPVSLSTDISHTLYPFTVDGLGAALPTAQGELGFPMRLAAHFLGKDRGGSPPSCRISTDCRAPAGSGLGGSSALGIALAKALDRYTERRLDDAALLSLTRSIETQVLRIPTGEQDYHPAL